MRFVEQKTLKKAPFPGPFLVGGTGLEPVTPSLSSLVRNQTGWDRRSRKRIPGRFSQVEVASLRLVSTVVADMLLTRRWLRTSHKRGDVETPSLDGGVWEDSSRRYLSCGVSRVGQRAPALLRSGSPGWGTVRALRSSAGPDG
jgi:hypothetical protein